MNRYTSDSKTLLLIGVGAIVSFSLLGPTGILVLGIVLLAIK